jgi:hypothetical protein
MSRSRLMNVSFSFSILRLNVGASSGQEISLIWQIGGLSLTQRISLR